jgi:RNA polymerase sigma-70 factor (ECF subfamily)
MHERVDRLPGLLSVDAELEREFEARLRESSTLAFRVAFAVLRHRQDAEDVAQDAFVKAYRAFARLRDRDRFRAWLVRITWRLALDRRRGDVRRIVRETSSLQPSGADAADELLEQERARQLWSAIDALPEKLRVVIVLANIEGHDINEVAKLLGVPAGTVKSRLFDARQRLKEHLTWTVSDPSSRWHR